ncbi:hydroxyacid dehydrogenase [uncultured Pantoea sp.]|uniref:hydroxyacid dehydrogenase n=1 Tax=uncultured Pantoea sp. TaxID=218084 RepID=UPI0037493E1A
MSEARSIILVTGCDLAEEALQLLTSYDVIFAGKQPTETQLIDLCHQHNPVAILVRYGKITAAVMDAAPALRVISKHGSGIDVIDQKAAAARNIRVCSAPGANAAAVAEHTWALLLASAKSVITLDARMRQGYWDKSLHKSLELEGCTLGLIGLGEIGRRVARAGLAFGMRVLAYDPYASSLPEGCERAETPEALYAQSDIVSLHCPLTDDNRAMINETALRHFRPGAILINTARGGLIDEPALAAALSAGRLRAAALDSFRAEPLTAPHRWQSLPNVILSPHIGGVSDASYIKMGTASAANIVSVLHELQQKTMA